MQLFNQLYKLDQAKIAIIEDGREISYGEFFGAVKRCTDFILSQKIPTSGRIAVVPMSGSGFLVSVYACQLSGVTPVAFPFIDDERKKGAIKQARIVGLLGDPTVSLSLSHIQAKSGKIGSEKRHHDEALIIFTSGTTSSKLKGVRLRHSGIASACDHMNTMMQMDHSTRELVFASLDHAYGLGRCHSVLTSGGTIILPKKIRLTRELLNLVTKYDCNALATPPSVLSSILRLSSNEIDLLSSRIRQIQTGAMRFDISFRKRLLTEFPRTQIFLHYGLSEAMRVTFFELNANVKKIHTEGPPSKNVTIKVFDSDGKVLPKNTEGLIGVKGDNLCLGYLDEKLWQSHFNNGYFITSDRGLLDDDGFLIFKGRADDVINANGVLVHPDEIEQKILKHWPGLKCSVLGVQDPKKIRDTIIILTIEGKHDLSLRKILQQLSNTDKAMVPQQILTFDELPKTRSGKINRKVLGALVMERLQAPQNHMT